MLMKWVKTIIYLQKQKKNINFTRKDLYKLGLDGREIDDILITLEDYELIKKTGHAQIASVEYTTYCLTKKGKKFTIK